MFTFDQITILRLFSQIIFPEMWLNGSTRASKEKENNVSITHTRDTILVLIAYWIPRLHLYINHNGEHIEHTLWIQAFSIIFLNGCLLTEHTMYVDVCYVRMYVCMYLSIYTGHVTIVFAKYQRGRGGAILGEDRVVGSVPFEWKSASEMRLGKQATRNVVRARWFPSILRILWEIIRTQNFVIIGFVAGGGDRRSATAIPWPGHAWLSLGHLKSLIYETLWNRKEFGPVEQKRIW
jgi:hypothetical protein